MSNNVYVGEYVDILENSSYYTSLPSILDGAKKSINVCMYHIALSSASHPSAILLQSLAKAKKRGVKVRVIVDRDRDDDPYMSNIVNKKAIDYLANNGVKCKHDSPDKLLHSKFLTIDGVEAVIGSHNWTTGSYFQYDDISFHIKSKGYTSYMERRFERIWKRGMIAK